MVALVTTTSRELIAYADTYRKTFCGTSLGILSVYGETTMVRGICAHLMSNGSVNIRGYDHFVNISKDLSYSTMTQSIGEGTSHAILVDRRATAAACSWDASILVTAHSETEAKSKWVSRFGRRCRIPIRASWGGGLWKLGVENDLIRSCKGFGLGMWDISLNTDRWQPIISEAVLDDKLDG
jgi:hypothetical protein